MKKFIALICVLFASIALCACNHVKEVKIEYNSNGGTEIASQSVNLDNIASFTLPADPVKEGYLFRGWYLDEEFTESFTALPNSETTVKLNAKWVEDTVENRLEGKGLNVSSTFNLDFKMVVDSVTTITKVSATANVAVLDVSVKDLKDLKAMLNVVISIPNEYLVGIPNVIALTAYVVDGYLYVTIPTMLSAKIDIKAVCDAVVAKVDELTNGEFEFNEEHITSMFNDVNEKLAGLKAEYGITDELINKVIEILKNLMPVKTVNGNTTKYEIKQAQVDKLIDDAMVFVEDEIVTIMTIVQKAITPEIPEETEIEDIGVLYTSTGKLVLLDESEVYIYESEYAENFGTLVGNNFELYYCYLNDAYYEVATHKYLTEEEAEEFMVVTTWIDWNGDTYNTGEPFCTDTDGVKHYFADDEEMLYGYEYEGLFYVSVTGEVFNTETWAMLTKEDLLRAQYSAYAVMINTILEQAKEYYEINALDFSYTINDEKLLSNVNSNIDIKIEEIADVTLKANFNADVTYSATFEIPQFDSSYIDMTSTIVDSINSLNEGSFDIGLN